MGACQSAPGSFADVLGRPMTVGSQVQCMMKDSNGNLTDTPNLKRGNGVVFKLTSNQVLLKFPPTNPIPLKYDQADINRFGIKVLLPGDATPASVSAPASTPTPAPAPAPAPEPEPSATPPPVVDLRKPDEADDIDQNVDENQSSSCDGWW